MADGAFLIFYFSSLLCIVHCCISPSPPILRPHRNLELLSVRAGGYLDGPATHRAVFDVRLRASARFVDRERDGLAAIRTVDLDFDHVTMTGRSAFPTRRTNNHGRLRASMLPVLRCASGTAGAAAPAAPMAARSDGSATPFRFTRPKLSLL